jgi:hypothetical protein
VQFSLTLVDLGITFRNCLAGVSIKQAWAAAARTGSYATVVWSADFQKLVTDKLLEAKLIVPPDTPLWKADDNSSLTFDI